MHVHVYIYTHIHVHLHVIWHTEKIQGFLWAHDLGAPLRVVSRSGAGVLGVPTCLRIEQDKVPERVQGARLMWSVQLVC